ncbi:hypothetical protein ANO14919_133540 [Xylariales sp. No.14919]|nr:hypothetical protein ANO14919_133540 [Xylariales sp. No.14919]
MRNRMKTLLKKASELAEEGVGIRLRIEYRGKIQEFTAAEPSPLRKTKLLSKTEVHDDCKAKESTTRTN